MVVRIRKATPEDAKPIIEIHRDSILRTCSGHYTPEQVRVWLAVVEDLPARVTAISSDTFLIAEENGRRLGFLHVRPFKRESLEFTALVGLYVEPSAQGQGVGKLLIATCEEAARSNGHSMIELQATLNAVTFYESMSYTEVLRESVTIAEIEVPCVRMMKRL